MCLCFTTQHYIIIFYIKKNREVIVYVANMVAFPLGHMPHVPSLVMHLSTFWVHSSFQFRREKFPFYVFRAEAKSQFIQKLSLNCLDMFLNWHGIRSHDHLPFFLSTPPGYKPSISHVPTLFCFDYYYLHIGVYMYVIYAQIFNIHFHLFFSCDCFFLAAYLLFH